MDELLNWDEVRRELIALLAGVLYLAAVRLIQRYKTALDRWLKPAEEIPLPTPPARQEPDPPATPDVWIDPPTDPPPDR